ncbi:hypothetical protein K470DRAFT_278189 [Piedraia hortae CBS 480.64]|uniref:DUF1690-domain-containing protein n=1 Tax=Piedraia hortae CBS 480.64 TaxID=1314780 RepID=A0A6A7BUD1_9PEZI|nr:hypothetical protein K470DRAFT_278189 [Piedraia hortae CBS 480.64]
MGNSVSTAVPSYASAQGITLSHALFDSLQRSPENDRTRAYTTELHAKQRLRTHLEQVRDTQAEKIDSIVSYLTGSESSSTAPELVPPEAAEPTGLFAHLRSPFYHDDAALQGKPVLTPEKRDSLSSKDAMMELEQLKSKLLERKSKSQDPEVEKTRDALVRCLRTHDRRPLDCWEEVEAFKKQVARLERGFVERRIGG